MAESRKDGPSPEGAADRESAASAGFGPQGGETLILVRHAPEISLKSARTRGRFMRVLHDNIRAALAGEGRAARLVNDHGRVFAVVDDPEDALARLAYVFGIASLSPIAARCPATVEDIVAAGRAAFTETVRGRTYAVRTRRSGRHDFHSQDVDRALGAALDGPGKVDLTNPDVTVGVEIVVDTAYLHARRVAGAGGLPAGVQGRAVCLVSGGFDSAVAAWRIMRRGVAVDFLFCNLGGVAHERMVLQVVKVLTDLWAAGLRPRFHVADFTAPVANLRESTRPKYWQLLLKRLMYRAACQLAAETKAEAIVTGESIGQVSSQTLTNLAAIDRVASMPVLRPLVGTDKSEIVAEARRIGTAVLSEKVKELCAISQGPPVTACDPDRADEEEARLDLGLVAASVAARKTIDVNAVGPTELRAPYLFTEEIPRDAVVIDCQQKHMYEAWHVPGARHDEPAKLIERLRDLDRDHAYVLYCTWGTQTPLLAELMQQNGYEAYAFKGGISAVRRYLESREQMSEDKGRTV